MRAEYQPGLLSIEYAMNKGLQDRLEGWQLLAEGIHREVLHAEHLIDDEAGEDFLVLHHQHATLFAQRRKLRAEEAAEIHDGQQAATHVGDPFTQSRTPGSNV